MSVIEIELTALNRNVVFPPLGRTRRDALRGTYNFREVGAGGAPELHRRYGVIPGNRIICDADKGKGVIVEPIHQDAKLKAKIERRWCLHPERREFDLPNPSGWIRAMVRLVHAGLATVTRGRLPDRVDPIIDPPTAAELLAATTYVGLSPEKQAMVDGKIIEMRRARR